MARRAVDRRCRRSHRNLRRVPRRPHDPSGDRLRPTGSGTASRRRAGHSRARRQGDGTVRGSGPGRRAAAALRVRVEPRPRRGSLRLVPPPRSGTLASARPVPVTASGPCRGRPHSADRWTSCGPARLRPGGKHTARPPAQRPGPLRGRLRRALARDRAGALGLRPASGPHGPNLTARRRRCTTSPNPHPLPSTWSTTR